MRKKNQRQAGGERTWQIQNPPGDCDFSVYWLESSERIPVYSLHSSLIDLTERIIHSTQLTILQTLDEDKSLFFEDNLKIDYENEDWFINIKYF